MTGHVTDGWSLSRELLALILEVLDAHRLDFVRVNAGKNARKLPDPVRFPRPGDARAELPKAPMVGAREAAAFFARR